MVHEVKLFGCDELEKQQWARRDGGGTDLSPQEPAELDICDWMVK